MTADCPNCGTKNPVDRSVAGVQLIFCSEHEGGCGKPFEAKVITTVVVSQAVDIPLPNPVDSIYRIRYSLFCRLAK